MSGSVAFDIKKYDNEFDMFDSISELTHILIKNDYDCLVRYEDCGIYVVEFNISSFRHKDWGDDRFMSVTADEADMIIENRILNAAAAE